MKYPLIVLFFVTTLGLSALVQLTPHHFTTNIETSAETGITTDFLTNDKDLETAEGESVLLPVVSAASESSDHLPTPDNVRGIYMTSWVAGTPSIRERVLGYFDTHPQLNSIIIDIKDDTGRISFAVEDPYLKNIGAEEVRIRDLRELISQLHERGIYVIGRISSFQDPYLVEKHPEWAVRRSSDGGVWEDRKGLTWLDPSNREVWDYLVAIGVESWRAGFDELNYDYIRFPTDGNLQDIAYSESGDKVDEEIVIESRKENIYGNDGITVIGTREVPTIVISGKSSIIRDFSEYLNSELDKKTEAVVSADLFGLATVAQDDLGIGQWLEYLLPHFDYIAPMTYPSHYADGWNGFANPAEHPYEVIKISMQKAVNRTEAVNQSGSKIRPWLQDFDIGTTYGSYEVNEQIRALNDLGYDSWLIWSPSNNYSL